MTKQQTVSRRILHFFFKQNKLVSDMPGIREVYFGIRARFLFITLVVMIFTVSILTLIMYLNNRDAIEEEKNAKAISLTRILSGPAEFYLDKNIDTTKGEIGTKYGIIDRESQNFIAYNDDIVKIVLTDESGRIKYSTQKYDYSRRQVISYIEDSLNQNEEQLMSYDYTGEEKNRKNGTVTVSRYRAVTYPVFLQSGDVLNILKDFRRLYPEYRTANRSRRDQIYSYLYNRYKPLLKADEYETGMQKKTKTKEKTGTKDRIKDKDIVMNKVIKKGDVDFLFLDLFIHSISFRNRKIPPGDAWRWDSKWLFSEKAKKNQAYLDDSSARAKEIDDLITGRITEMSDKVDKSRRLGVIAIVFNVDKIKQSSARNIEQIIDIALIIIVLSGIALFFVLNYNVKNLKKLESWAISVSQGNLDEKINIAAKDEIGRLSDITNYMIGEIKTKFHLEKFVSRSTRSVIERQKSLNEEIDLGVTGRKKMAFIFSDVRGFTSFSEKEDPATVVEVLNFYLELQSNIIKSNKGDIDDYVGDQIMSHFSGEKRADRAIGTAIKMMKEVTEVNVKRKADNLPVFEVGIGVHDGDVVVGNIGSKFRMDFACIGDAVSLTSRLCSAARPGEIIVSSSLYKQAKEKYSKIDTDPIEVKGKEKKIQIVKIQY